jgi:hypothetical protein
VSDGVAEDPVEAEDVTANPRVETDLERFLGG